MDSELLASLIEAISVLNQKQKDLEADNEGITKELNDFEGEYAKETKQLQEQIDAVTVTIDRLIKEAIKDIPLAKDGVDGKDYDEAVAKALLKAEINKLVKQRNLETEKIKSEVLQAVSEIEIPKARDGKDGKSVTDEQIQDYISTWLDENIDSLKGEKGERGIQGERGRDGEDGISITDAKIVNDYLILTFSDGSIKRVKMPKQRVMVGGGGVTQTAKEVPYDNSDSNGLTKTNVKEALDELSFASGGVSDLVFKNRTQIEAMFNSAYTTAYSELVYIDGNISQINVYEDATKLLQLFTKDITYTSGNITQIAITNNLTNFSLTKTLSYDVDNNISEIRVA